MAGEVKLEGSDRVRLPTYAETPSPDPDAKPLARVAVSS